MINIQEFPEIVQTPHSIELELKEVIIQLLSPMYPGLLTLETIDEVVYQGKGSFTSGVLNYNSTGIKMHSDAEPFSLYIFDKLPARSVINIFDHLNYSEFIIEPHPTQAYDIKVQKSFDNTFQFIRLPDAVFIFSINGTRLLGSDSICAQELIEHRAEKINNIVNSELLGEIPHRLASEFAAPLLIDAREALQNTPNWVITCRRELTQVEKNTLDQLNQTLPILRILGLSLFAIFQILSQTWQGVFFAGLSVLVLFYMMSNRKRNPLRNDDVLTVQGIIKVTPNTFFNDPLSVKFSLLKDLSQIKEKQVYTFDVLKKSREIIDISGADGLAKRRSSNVAPKVKTGIMAFFLAFATMQSVSAPSLFSKNLSYLERLRLSVQMLSWPIDNKVIDYTQNSNFIPELGQQLTMSFWGQCDNQQAHEICTKIHVRSQPEQANAVKIKPLDLENDENGFLTALHAHYETLMPSNELIVDRDINRFAWFNTQALYYGYWNDITYDEGAQFKLTHLGFEALSQAYPMTFSGTVIDIEHHVSPNKRWVMYLQEDIQKELILAYFHFALTLFICGLLLIMVGNRMYEIYTNKLS